MSDMRPGHERDAEAQLYAELRARVTLFEETRNADLLNDPEVGRLAAHLLTVELAKPEGVACDVAHTLATVLWHREEELGRAPGANHGQGRTERHVALLLYAGIDTLLPALVPPEARQALRRLSSLSYPPNRLGVCTESRLSELFEHGLAAVGRYDRLRDRPTLRLGLALLRELVAATPEGSPYARTLGVLARTTLGAGLQRELDLTGDPEVLSEALAVSGEAVKRCAEHNPDRPLVLFNFGSLLLEQHQRAGDEDALRESLRVSLLALNLTPDHDPGRAARLCHVQHLHSLEYDGTRDLGSLRKAVGLGREAVRVVPPDYHQRAGVLHNLGKDLHTLYEVTGDLADLRESVETQRAAVVASRHDDPRGLSRRQNLARFLVDLARTTRDADTVRQAVAVSEENVQLAPPGHAQHRVCLDALHNALALAAWDMRDPEGRTDAVAVARRRVAAAVDGGSRIEATKVLAATLKKHYEVTGDLNALAESIRLYRWLTDPTSLALLGQNRGPSLRALADALHSLYLRSGELDALDAAEQTARRALSGARTDGVDRAESLVQLGAILQTAMLRATDEDTYVQRATEGMLQYLEAEKVCPKDHDQYPQILAAVGLACHHLLTSDATMLAQAARHLEEAVEALPIEARNGPEVRASLAQVLLARHRYDGEEPDLLQDIPDDLPHAAALARAAVAAVAEDEPRRGQFLTILAQVLDALAETDGTAQAAAEAAEAYRAVATLTTALPDIRFGAAGRLASKAMDRRDAEAAVAAVETALSLLPSLAARELTRPDRQHRIQDTAGLASTAAAAAVAAGRPALAVELLEQTRGLLDADALPHPDSEHGDLRRTHPALAREYEELRTVGTRTATHEWNLGLGGLSNRGASEERHQINKRWKDLLARIRTVPGHERFLRAPTIEWLRQQAADGPIVLVYASSWRSDALVLRPGADPRQPVDVVPLPRLDAYEASDSVNRLQRIVTNAASANSFDARERSQDALHTTLEWMWEAIARPVLDHLGIDGNPSKDTPRIWWCPVGFLANLPLHAAGRHRDPRRGDELPPTVLDRTISSTTTGIRALKRARARARTQAHWPPTALIVAMPQTPGAEPLAQAAEEGQSVGSLLRSTDIVTTLVGPQATSDAVRDHLHRHGLAHFVCHALTDPVDPSRNRLLLADHQRRPLTVADLAELRLPSAELAYLSACSTAVTTPRLADEAIHITAAFQLAGYSHVVGTLWPVGDAAAAAVADGFYRRLTHNGLRPPDTGEAARALHETLRELRDRFLMTPTRWAAYLHMGP